MSVKKAKIEKCEKCHKYPTYERVNRYQDRETCCSGCKRPVEFCICKAKRKRGGA